MSHLSTLAAKADALVRPGWVALLVVALLCVATFFLWRNMNKQLRKIQVPPRGQGSATASTPAADEREPGEAPAAGEDLTHRPDTDSGEPTPDRPVRRTT